MDWRLAKIAARLMADVPRGVPTPPPPPPEIERQSGVVALRQALRVRGRRLRGAKIARIVAATSALAVAAVLALTLLTKQGWMPSGNPGEGQTAQAQVIRAWGAQREGTDLADGTTVRPGQRLHARGRDGSRMSFSSGTELRLMQHAELEVKAIGNVQRFGLTQGRLHAEVAPLGAGQRFVIETPDGEIEVHGTVFELAVVAPPPPGCAVPTRTRVRVARGVVEVRAAGRDDYVRAGEHWPAECDAVGEASAGGVSAVVAAAGAPAAVSDRARSAPPRQTHHDTTGTGRAPAGPRSALMVQNDLFAASMAAKSRGQAARALELLDDLILRFPRGPLVEAAHIERLRLHREMGNGPAVRRHAHEYLRTFPDGLARAEAHLALGLTP